MSPKGARKKVKMSATEVAAFARDEISKNHEDAVYDDYQSDAAKKRFKLSVTMGPVYQRRLRIGNLKILLIEAANLPAADLGGKSDPYAKLILTGKNKYGNEWVPERRTVIQSATVKKDLNPRWHESHDMAVPRHDSVLRVELYDEDASSADDLLGYVEIPVGELAFQGLVKRWFPITVTDDFTAASAAVHLHLEYDVSALGEACSMLWAEQPKAKDTTRFDVNLMYQHGMALKREMKPYLDAAGALENVLKWKNNRTSAKCLAVGLFVALFIAAFWEMFHAAVCALLVRNYFARRRLDRITAEAAGIFIKIDADGGGSLDRNEIGQAMAELAAKNGTAIPPEGEIDALFRRADVDGGGGLDLEEFTQLCIDSPSIMGFGVDHEEEEEEEDHHDDEDAEAAALLDGSHGAASPSSARPRFAPALALLKKKEEDPAKVEDVKGPVSGIAKRMINLAGRGAGGGPAVAMRSLGSTARDARMMRDLLEWKDAKKTAPILAGNAFMIVFHALTPMWMFAVPAVIGGFCVLTEKLKAFERVAARGAKARARYVHLHRLKAGTADTGGNVVLASPKERPVLAEVMRTRLINFSSTHKRRLIQSVVQGIFSRLDEDGSGSVDADELSQFLILAMPNASPRARAMLGGDPTAVARVVERLVHKFDANGDGVIDMVEFTEIVRQTGCVEVLLQDELSRQLKSDGGVKCVKLATKKGLFLSSKSRARTHPTAITVTPREGEPPTTAGYIVHDLAYTTRKGDRRIVGNVATVEPHAVNEGKIAIRCDDGEPLYLMVSPLLRDPLVDLLTLVCTGTPLPVPLDIMILRRGSDLSLDKGALAKGAGGGHSGGLDDDEADAEVASLGLDAAR